MKNEMKGEKKLHEVKLYHQGLLIDRFLYRKKKVAERKRKDLINKYKDDAKWRVE